MCVGCLGWGCCKVDFCLFVCVGEADGLEGKLRWILNGELGDNGGCGGGGLLASLVWIIGA